MALKDDCQYKVRLVQNADGPSHSTIFRLYRNNLMFMAWATVIAEPAYFYLWAPILTVFGYKIKVNPFSHRRTQNPRNVETDVDDMTFGLIGNKVLAETRYLITIDCRDFETETAIKNKSQSQLGVPVFYTHTNVN